jgi:FkbM family methyltransferase
MPRLRPNLSFLGRLHELTPQLVIERREAQERGLTRMQLSLVKAWHLQMLPSLDVLEGGTIIDVGAHEGEWTSAILELVPDASVIAVEPQDDLRAKVEQRFSGDSRVRVIGAALAESEGPREFHLTGASVNASLHVPQPEMDELYRSGWDLQETVTVQATTVDALAAGDPVALLKIDVQGAEHEVLAGAGETLRGTSAVMLEVTFISHYDGDATFPTLHQRMTDAGFLLTGISPPARSPAGAMLCADACYVNARHLDDYFCRRTERIPR